VITTTLEGKNVEKPHRRKKNRRKNHFYDGRESIEEKTALRGKRTEKEESYVTPEAQGAPKGKGVYSTEKTHLLLAMLERKGG